MTQEFQDQGSLDQPAQDVDTTEPRPGPVNPVLDAQPEVPEEETVIPAVDDAQGESTIERVNEARESGQPFDGDVIEGGEQPAYTPTGTGTTDL